MGYRYDEFPEHGEPVYDFYISDGSGLRVRKYHKYEIETSAMNRRSYRIHTGANIITKRQDQMDRVLSGHVFTFEYNPERVLELMAQRAEADTVKAAVMAENARGYRQAVDAAAKKPVVEETYGTVIEHKPKRAWVPVDGES